MKAIAAEALLMAVNEGMPIPARTGRVLWAWLQSVPATRPWRTTEYLGGIIDEDVRADALRILDLDDAGSDLRGVALDLLCGPTHAVHVHDDVLLRLLERLRCEEDVRQLRRLVEAVHRARGVAPALLLAIRDRLAGSSSPFVREAGVDLGVELAEPDVEFAATMINDPNADVRIAVAAQLEVGLFAADVALGLVEGRLRAESHPQVRAALLRAQAELVESRRGLRRRNRS